MEIYKDNNGDYICKICGKAHTTLQLAFNCLETHKAQGPPKESPASQPMPVPVGESSSNILEYKRDVLESGTLEAAKRLCLSLIEDYEVTRTRDMQEKGKIGPMTMNLGKLASEALNGYNKLVYGEKSAHLSVSVDGKKKSDLDAIRQILTNNNQTPITLDDGEERTQE